MKRYQEITLVACRRSLVTVSLCMLALLTGQALAQTSNINEQPSISLPWVLEQTLLHNAQLKTYPYELRANEAATIQAGITPNPKFSMSVENVLGTGNMQGVENAEVTLALSQLIELGDKRQRRVDFAQAQQQQQMRRYEQQRLAIMSDATERYYQVLRLQALQAWGEKRLALESKALNTIELRAKAGAVPQADVSKLALRLHQTKAAQQQLNGEAQVAKYRLAAMWSSEPTFNHVSGELSQLQQLPTLASVLNAVESAPQYLALLSVERLMYAKRRMEESKAQYDITLGMGVKGVDGFDDGALMFNFSMPIPLSNPNQGNILAAKAKEDMALEQQRLARGQIKLTLMAIHQAMLNNAKQAQRLKQQLVPMAQRLLNDSQLAYQAGQINVLQLVDAQSQLVSVERELIEANTLAYMQLLELERITGQSMTATHISTSVALENQ
ncbi:TolC family protein [Shewanella sp. UCD-KL12]|uniref:TolC family protein n=1 Tax=Shewanella sp. UCD-KL12 TaxID=1917163 RepID=UPI0009F82820|nr:TolC family protein [Shewanella sp. UCD-KL12]